MQISAKPLYKLTDSLLFLMGTLVFLAVYFLTFRGFNGTDDMHYSMLAARLVQHRFDPFVPTDIFCGRVALIFTQSLIYRLGGISVFTTEAGTLLCTILTCWLIIFRFADEVSPVKTVLVCAFFYFAPTLVPAIRGIMPDAYVMLTLVLLMLLWKKIFSGPGNRRRYVGGALAGATLALALLFKESLVVCIPLFIVLSVKNRRSGGLRFLFPMLGAAAVTLCLMGLVYLKYTSHFFFRAEQIHNNQLIENARPGSCNCRLDRGALVERLTFGPWRAFVLQGFLPVLMPVLYLLLRTVTATRNRFSFNQPETVFIVLLFTILYFPAGLDQYQPVCSDARQYLMLMPFGTLVLAEPLFALFSGAPAERYARFLLPASATVLLCLVAGLSPNKWKWLTYGCWFTALLLPLVVRTGRTLFLSACLLTLMAFTGLERLFFHRSPWFSDLQRLQQELGTAPAYFPEHDNFIQWEFLCGYENTRVANLEIKTPPVLDRYYPVLKKFEPGWFILNRSYTVRSPAFLSAVEQLDREHFFSARKTENDVSAFRIDAAGQLDRLTALLRREP